MLLRGKIFTEKRVALVCAAVLLGLLVYPVLKYAGLLGGDDSSVLRSGQRKTTRQAIVSEKKTTKEAPVAEQTSVAEKPKDTYNYTAEAGGSYTLAARQAINSYIDEEKISVDDSRRLVAEVNLVNAAGAPYLEIGQAVTISRADVAKELSVKSADESVKTAKEAPVAESADTQNNATDTSKQNDIPTQNDDVKDTQKQKPAATSDVVKIATVGDSYTLIAREAVKSVAAGSLNDAQKIAAETYLASQAGFPELAVGQNVTINNSAIQNALKFARGLTAEQQAAWQVYVPYVVF